MKQLDDLTNAQILAAFINGDSTAFNEIYYRYRSKVNSYAYRFTRSVEAAEELTQDVFVRLWENREKVDPSKNFEAFLFTLTRNNFLQALRKKAQSNNFVNEQLREEPAHNSIDDYINFKECQQIAGYAIGNLSPQVKIAYLLSRDNGCSHEDISRQMGISKNTVHNHIKQSLKSLRKSFKLYSPETTLLLTLFLFF